WASLLYQWLPWGGCGLLRPIGRLSLQPFGEPFVETSTVLAGHAVIRGEPDQDVTEPEPVRAGALDQSPALQSVQVALDERTCIIGKKRPYRVRLHVHAGDRCAAEHVALAGPQSVEPHGAQPPEGGWHCVGG